MEHQNQAAKFLALLAHEIRSPLSVILNSAYIINSKDDATPEYRAHCDMIMRQARQIDDIANTLIHLSRINLGKESIPTDTFLLCKELTDVIESSRSVFEKKSMRVNLETPPENTLISGSKTLIKQAMINLLSNAAKYSPSHTEVNVTVTLKPSKVLISVIDEGYGLNQSEARSVFGLYSQSQDHTSNSGLGVGLYLVRKIAKLHRGGVSVESEGHGKGCNFKLWLPTSHSLNS